MRIKILFISVLFLMLGLLNMHSQNFKPYATAVWIGSDSSSADGTFYNVSYSSPNGFLDDSNHAINQNTGTNFNGRNFGIHNTNSGGLILKGAEVKTFKQNNGNTCVPQLRIKTYLTADGPPNGWDTRDINYFKGCDLGNSRFPDSPGHGPCNTDGYQKWQGLTFHGDQSNKVEEFNLTNRKEGSYTLEIYFRIPGDYDGNNCDETEYDNDNGNPNNYRASYTICPTYSNGSKTDPTTCGGLDGVITLNYSGLVDGTDFYNGKFSHDGGVFPDGSVSVTNDVVTISGLSAGTYSNIVYTSSVNGCGTVGGGTFVLTTDDLIPTAPVIGTITNPTCLVTTGSVQLSGLPSGNWIITETVTMTSIPGSGSSAIFTGLTASTTYRFTVTSDKNCTSLESANAIIGTVLSVPSTATVQTDCSGGFGNAVLTITNPTGAGFQYSLDGGVFQDSPIFSSVGNGSRVIRVKNSDGCISTTTTAEAPNLNVNCGCPPGDTPDVSLTTNSGSTCSITPVTINGTFMGNNVQVTSITTSNGAGVFDATSASTSPFSFTYTPDPSDIGKDIIINVVTNNPFGSPCTEGTAQYTLAVTDTQPPVVTDADQSFCVIDNPTVDDLRATGVNIKWYTVATGGTPLGLTDPITTGSYYASQNNGTCESYYRTEVKVSVNNTVPPTVNDPTQEFCVINNPTVADLSANGTNILWYSQATGGIPLSINTPLTNGVYYASQNDGTCESSTRTQVTVSITDSNPPTGQSTQSFCAIDTPTLAQIVLAGENVKWFAFQNGGAELPLSTQLIGYYD